MAKLTKDSISALDLDAAIKTDLLDLFDSITEKENEISSIRAKVPTDSQKVVESVDYDKFTAAQKELGELKARLETELGKTDEGNDLLSAFPQFF